jgi:ABC-type transporter Mla MlaB component
MLRITPINKNGSKLLKLEGKLLGPWTGEVLAQIGLDEGALGRTRLDLSQVSFVDAMGLSMLRELVNRGVVIDACSGFIAELLHMEKP